MAAPASVDEFLDLLRKSGVIDDRRLDAYLQKNRSRLPADSLQAAGVLLQDGLLTLFQKENILAGRWRRFFIGKYKVLERLGSGGMGQVYLCEHTLMRRRVAVKVLPTAKAKDSSALERFYREARAVAALTHPNIVHAYDIDQNEDLHFLVMEYVDGSNLQDIVKISGPLDVARACHYIRQSALALQHAHEAGLVHRDVKPGNILVDRSGMVKILDLGLARFFHDQDDVLTQKYEEHVLGTADYLSPEQALDSHAADIRADIYSLGATFYFLLGGRPPFESANVAQKLMMHQMREPKPIQEYRRDVPAGVLAILQKMMAKAPDNRYAVPGDVADALLPFTQEAIAPPSSVEMPHLSPAATGTGSFAAVDAPETAISKNHTPRAAPGSAAATVNPASAGSRATATAPKPAVEQGAEVVTWEQIAHDTEDPSAKADTKPQSSRSSPRSKKNLQTSRRTLIVAAVLVSALLVGLLGASIVGGVVLWRMFFAAPANPGPVTPPGPIKLLVSKDPNRGTYDSIHKALARAKPGAIIELCDSVHEENVVIGPPRGVSQITLQAAPGKEVIWRSAKNDANLPILRLAKAADFKLKGKGITLDGSIDGKPRINDLLVISADCSGMSVEDVHFKSFVRDAVLLMNSTGADDRPIHLLRLTTITDKAEKPRAAIYFDADPAVAPKKNAFIEIKNCEYRGIELLKAVQFKNKDVLETSVSWPGR